MTAAYGAAKGAAPRAKAVTRQFLHLGDDLFVVYDRVAAAGPGLKKRFILQSYDEPALDGEEKVVEGAKGDGVSVSGETGLITSVRGPSKLFCRVLLPEKRTVTKVGGPTYWCFSGGKFYKPTKSSFRDPQRAHREGMPLWRSEISPAGPSAFDDFLVVLEAAPGDRPSPVPCDLKLQGSAVRLAIDGQRARYEVNFLRSRDGGRIRITRAGRTLVGRDFTRRIDVPAGNPIVPAGG